MYPPALINGLVVATVSSLEDPENLARIQVTYAVLGAQVSDWAKLVSLMAGKDRGTLFRPEIGDEVLIGFEMGCADRPYILGALWNKEDLPPAMGDPAKDNDWRVIKSRSGHILKFNDKPGAETIEIRDKDDARTIVIDTANKKIQVLCDGADGEIEVRVPQGTMKLEADKKITVTCNKGDIAVVANGGGKVTVDSQSSNVEVSASAGTVKVDALRVEVSASTSMKLKAGADMTIESTGPMTIKGAVVNIN